MALAQLILQFFSTVVIAGIGAFFTYNYRIQTRLKVLELRVNAYRQLFAATESASPTRLHRGEALSTEEAAELGKRIYDWYYENGNGLLMPERTRRHLQALQRTLQGQPHTAISTDPLINEVSKLRTMLRQDVGVFGRHQSGWYKG